MAELSLRRNVYAGRGDFGFGGFQSPTGSMSQPGTGGGTINTILSAAGSLLGPLIQSGGIFGPKQKLAASPMQMGGGSMFPMFPSSIGSGINRLLGTGSSVAAPGDLFGAASERVRPLSKVPVTGPDGRLYWFGYLGRPVLFSGDLAAARRVGRVARRAARFSRRRGSVRRRR